MSSERNLLHFNLKKLKSHQKEFGFVKKKKDLQLKNSSRIVNKYTAVILMNVYISEISSALNCAILNATVKHQKIFFKTL